MWGSNGTHDVHWKTRMSVRRLLKKIRCSLLVLSALCCLTGCLAAVPIVVVGGAQLYNSVREQYPSVDFESEAPVKVTYLENQNRVWDALIDTLQVMEENFIFVDKISGIVSTEPRRFNDISWVDKSLGRATFRYVYNIVCTRSSVKVVVKFTEEKLFDTPREKNIPEGSNMMRHILFENLSHKLTKIAEEFSG